MRGASGFGGAGHKSGIAHGARIWAKGKRIYSPTHRGEFQRSHGRRKGGFFDEGPTLAGSNTLAGLRWQGSDLLPIQSGTLWASHSHKLPQSANLRITS